MQCYRILPDGPFSTIVIDDVEKVDEVLTFRTLYKAKRAIVEQLQEQAKNLRACANRILLLKLEEIQ